MIDEQNTFSYQLTDLLLALEDFKENSYEYWKNEAQRIVYSRLSKSIETKINSLLKIVHEIEVKMYEGGI